MLKTGDEVGGQAGNLSEDVVGNLLALYGKRRLVDNSRSSQEDMTVNSAGVQEYLCSTVRTYLSIRQIWLDGPYADFDSALLKSSWWVEASSFPREVEGGEMQLPRTDYPISLLVVLS